MSHRRQQPDNDCREYTGQEVALLIGYLLGAGEAPTIRQLEERTGRSESGIRALIARQRTLNIELRDGRLYICGQEPKQSIKQRSPFRQPVDPVVFRYIEEERRYK